MTREQYYILFSTLECDCGRSTSARRTSLAPTFECVGTPFIKDLDFPLGSFHTTGLPGHIRDGHSWTALTVAFYVLFTAEQFRRVIEQ